MSYTDLRKAHTSSLGQIARFAIVFLLGCVVGAYALHLYRGFMVPAKQITTLASMQFWRAVLSNVLETTGEYPDSLSEALESWEAANDLPPRDISRHLYDSWGHRLHYVRTDEGFVLASFGRGGQCDVRDLGVYANWGSLDESPCYAAHRDTVMTHTGFTKGCGK